ncbi:hypothetical protein H8E50_08490, partial [bacterium]|nr:hypothetical protein [bacterium]
MQKLGRANIMLICFTVMIIVNMAAVNAYSQQRTINYQGYLTDSTGPVNGPVMLILSIHDALSEGSQLWTETHPAVDVVDGIYNLQLGSIVWLNVDFNFPRFLQVAVDNGLTGVQVLSPRQQLLSVSHAINAEKSGLSDYAYNADKVDGRHASALDQSAHVADSSNPHGVSPASIGAAAASQFNQHAGSSANPHGVTAAQTGAAVLSDVTAAVTGHASDASAHHARYTDNEARAAVGSVIPSGFAILGDSDIPPAGYSYTGETMQSNGAGWKHEP